MLLPTSVTNRRKFLERTALGAGSVLFLPGLLISCADHRIPDPNAPGMPSGTPLVVGDSDMPIDLNDGGKTLIAGLLGSIPEIGSMLAALLGFLWPGTDVWSQVKDQVEALVDKKLTDDAYRTVHDLLEGLKNDLTSYLKVVKIGTQEDIRIKWGVVENTFETLLPLFQDSEYKAPLLGLFANFANLHLAHLRDVVIDGKRMGRNAATQADDINTLQTTITSYIQYAQTTYSDYLDYLTKNIQRDDSNVEPFATLNRYTRGMTINVLDYTKFWPLYDVTKYPKGAKVLLPRELYSDPVGSLKFNSDIPISLPSPPTQGPTNLTVWGSTGGVSAVQLTYPYSSGPNGVTTTPRMGRQDVSGATSSSPGTTDQPYGRILPISSNNPIIKVRTSTGGHGNFYDAFYGIGVYAMELMLKDGTIINKVGGDNTGQWSDWVSIYDHFISSIYIHGALTLVDDLTIGANTWNADCIVFGFKYLNGGPTITIKTLEQLYITHPRELSGAEITQAFPTFGLTNLQITDNLKAARQAFWAAIEATK